MNTILLPPQMFNYPGFTVPQIYDLENLTNEDWKVLEELVSILDILEASTRVLCGDSYSSLSMFIPTINLLIDHINERVIQTRDVVAFKKSLLNCVNRRFAKAEGNKFALISTVLDPRFKKSI